MLAQLEVAHGVEDRLIAPAAPPNYHQAVPDFRLAVKTHAQRPQQCRQILARLERTDEQHKRVGLDRRAIQHTRLAHT